MNKNVSPKLLAHLERLNAARAAAKASGAPLPPPKPRAPKAAKQPERPAGSGVKQLGVFYVGQLLCYNGEPFRPWSDHAMGTVLDKGTIAKVIRLHEQPQTMVTLQCEAPGGGFKGGRTLVLNLQAVAAKWEDGL